MGEKRELRTIIRPVRFSETEWAAVQLKIAGRDFGPVVRAQLIGGAIPEPKTAVRVEIRRPRMTEAEGVQARQMAWIGATMGQIAKAAKSGAGRAAILGQLFTLCREIKKLQ